MTRPRWSTENSVQWIRLPTADDHKYRRGVLGVRTGSSLYPGAAVLGVEAAWRTGIGMVRYVPPVADAAGAHSSQVLSPELLVMARRPETVLGAGAVDAWLAGSGVDQATQSPSDRDHLVSLLAGTVPLVLDAGALDLVVKHPHPAAPTIITPHLGEFRTLWRAHFGSDLSIEGRDGGPTALAEAARTLAQELSVTILLKGSITRIAPVSGELVEVGPTTPWLATAGTGDVLAGILGALVASHASSVHNDPSTLVSLAATAVSIHDLAARVAARLDTSPQGQPITALDVADSIPSAIRLICSSPFPQHVPVHGKEGA